MKLLFVLLLRKTYWFALCSVFVVIPANYALAGKSERLNSDAVNKPIDEIAVVSNRVARKQSELSGSVSVLEPHTLTQLAPVHIQEALRAVPGVNFQRGNGQESLPSIRSAVLTGAGACGSNLILEEGIPVRGVGFCNVNELFDTHYEQAGQIQVLRGAQSAFYGSNGLTGSINVSLPSIGRDRISLELGDDSYRRVKTAISYGGDEFNKEGHYGRVYVSLTETDGFRDDSGYEQQKFSVRHRYQYANLQVSAGITATYLDQQTAGFLVGLDSYRDRQQIRRNLDPEAFRKTQAIRAWSSFEWLLNDRQRLVVKPYVRFTDMDFRLHFLPGDPLEENSQQGLGWQSSLSTDFDDQLIWTIGIDGELSKGDLRQTQDQATQGSRFLQETIPTGVHYDYEVDAEQFAVFSHIDWQASEKLKIIVGGRLETVSYDYDNLSLDGRTREDGSECGFGGCRYSRPADREDRFTHFSPKFELRYQVAEGLQFRASIADSFRAPQATELYRLQRAQTVADLDTVRAASLEIGLNWQTNQHALDLALYRIEQKNLIIRDSDFFNVDGQATDSMGLELAYAYTFNEQWSVRVAGAYAQHEYASDQFSNGESIRGNRVDTAPELYGSLFLAWQPLSKLSTELEISHVDDYFLNIENTSEYPGHTLAHLRGSYHFNEYWTASMRINNLSNKRFAERADFTSFTAERYFPGAPRSVFAELRWQF